MSKFKFIIISVLCAALLFAGIVFLPSMFEEEISQLISSESAEESSLVISDNSKEDSLPEENSKPEGLDSFKLATEAILQNIENLDLSVAERFDENYIIKICDMFGESVIEELAAALAEGAVDKELFKNIIGYTEKAFVSLIEGDLDRTTVLENSEDGITDMVFVGDCGFFDGYSVMNNYNARGKGAEGIVSKEVLDIMRAADITMANNEFTFTTRGSPVPNKKFTFRSNPKNVSIYYELGVDIVGLANNHAFDYGPDSLTDTLATLDQAGINRVGAGENIDEARAPYFYIVNGYKIAIIAGTSIDLYSTRSATETQSGVFQIYTTTPMVEEIAAAKEKADFVIAYVHWGHESTTVLTPGQKSMGKAFVDAGADLVVGMHSHCMQGVEYYNGKLIVYSLGNFAFSSFSLTCGMLKTSISKDGELTNIYYPMMQSGNFTYINSGEAGDAQLKDLRKISINANISDEFIVTEP